MTVFLTLRTIKCKKQNIKRWDKENINTKGTDFFEAIDEQMIKGNSSMTTDKRWKNLESVMTTQAKKNHWVQERCIN